ncbi:uncharacterized protein LOC125945202 [Dermacentor silvarum]|uniref:uncharacterized protein LOC125945202 n=1 Tax=Dermacentor silvarum TaxID=543639 RepID=UPI002100B789|nr:uncharacterized protein LOC125945202 [Dermacentor silvarum]
MLAYADEIALFCRDKESIEIAIAEVLSYCRTTGSAINFDKCLGVWIGNWVDPPSTFVNIQWTVTPAKYLGVPLEHYRDAVDYWNAEAERVRECTLKWGGRNFSMFARATVCNLFAVAKIFYVLQALCMSRANIQRLHRVLAVFVWGSSWERTSRTNLFRSVKSGGLGLAHLFIRQIVSRFVYLRDQKDPFLLTMFQVRLSEAILEFIVSSRRCSQGRLRGFLKEVVWAFQLLKVRFSMEYLSRVPRKRLYKDLIEAMLPVPLYRSMFCTGPEKNVLKRVKRMPVRPSAKSFFFQLHTNTLPVKPWLEEKGLFVPWSVNCLICRKPETVEHIFLDCWDAVFHWDVLQRTLKKDLPITPYGIRFLPTQNEDTVPYDMFMLLSLHSLWKCRMAVRHAEPNLRSVREYFIESICYIKELYSLQKEQPTWLSVMTELANLKRF